jgi:hypothetical protein
MGEEEREMLGRWPGMIVVWNRADRGGVREGLCTCAVTGEGVEKVAEAVRGFFGVVPGVEGLRMRF